MKRPPTDLELIEEIYHRYYSSYIDPRRLEKDRYAKLHVPIDIPALAEHFGVDSDIIFGRLHYHLNNKYGYEVSEGPGDGERKTRVDLFLIRVGGDKHCVQFPLLASLVADLREQRNQYLWSLWLSIPAAIISLISLTIALTTCSAPASG